METHLQLVLGFMIAAIAIALADATLGIPNFWIPRTTRKFVQCVLMMLAMESATSSPQMDHRRTHHAFPDVSYEPAPITRCAISFLNHALVILLVTIFVLKMVEKKYQWAKYFIAGYSLGGILAEVGRLVQLFFTIIILSLFWIDST